MRTDELSRALEDAARSFEPSTADARTAVERRFRRHRQRLVATVASLCVVVGAGAVFAVEHRGDGSTVSIAATRDEKLVAVRDARRGEAFITAPVTNSVAQLRAIETRIASSDAVVRYARLSRLVQVQSCGAGPKWIVALEAGHSIGDLQRQLGAAPTAMPRAAALRRWPLLSDDLADPNALADLELFMRNRATPAQIAGARAVLRSTAGVVWLHFLDHNDAYAEFRRVFRDNPELVKNTSPRDLPQSFRVKLSAGTDATAITRRLKALPGADTVVESDRSLLDEVQPLESLVLPNGNTCRSSP
jgi:hypothetical protein